jgi:hypothetical protein
MCLYMKVKLKNLQNLYKMEEFDFKKPQSMFNDLESDVALIKTQLDLYLHQLSALTRVKDLTALCS